MSKFWGVIYALLMLLKSYNIKKEQVDAQQQADQISKDPTDWFNSHFDSGLSSQPAEAKASKATHIRIDN